MRRVQASRATYVGKRKVVSCEVVTQDRIGHDRPDDRRLNSPDDLYAVYGRCIIAHYPVLAINE